MPYDAFISYSHAGEEQLAAKVQEALHQFARPLFKLRSLHVFRDKTVLSATPGLWASIEKALGESSYFLLMASPQSARSKWVEREVEWWLANRSSDRLFILLSDGELAWDASAGDFDKTITTSLPHSLHGRFASEPLWVDLRSLREPSSMSLRHIGFRGAILDIAAPILGKPKDELDGFDVRQHRRLRVITRSGIAALSILTILSIFAAWNAIRNAREARNQREIADTRRREAEAATVSEREARVQETEARRTADEQRGIAETQRDIAEERRIETERQQQISLSRQFAAQSATNVGNNTLDTALLYAIKAFETNDNYDTRDSLLSALESNSRLLTFLRGHTRGLNAARIHDIAFHPNGRILASAGEDRKVILWDAVERRRLGQELFTHPMNAVLRIVFSPNGEQIASLGLDGVWIWRASDGQKISEIQSPLGEWESLAFSPDGQAVATGNCVAVQNRRCSKGAVALWATATGKLVRGPLEGHAGAVTALAFHPKQKELASAASDSSIRVWNTETGQLVRELRGHYGTVFSLAYSPDGTLLASAGLDRTVRLWNVSDGAPHGEPLLGHDGAVYSVAFNKTGSLLASGGEDRLVRLWEIATGRPFGIPINGHRDRVTSVAFSSDGHTLASGSADNLVMLSNVARQSPVGQILEGTVGGAKALAYSPDGKTLICGGSSGSVRVWKSDGEPVRNAVLASGVREIQDASGRVTGSSSSHLFMETAAFTRNGERIAIGSLDGRIRILNASTLAEDGSGLQHPGEVRSVAFSPDGKVLASSGSRGSIVIWDVAARKQLVRLKGHMEMRQGVNAPEEVSVYSVAFSPDGKWLASGSFDRTVILWDVRTWKPKQAPLQGHTGWVDRVEFSPDGRTLASADVDGAIRFWDVATGRPSGDAITMPDRGYTYFAYAPDGKHVAAATAHTFMLWDLATRRPVAHPFRGPTGQFEAVAFSPDGNTVATGDFDGKVVQWNVSLSSWTSMACAKSNRNLTTEEWSSLGLSIGYTRICKDLPLPVSVVDEQLEAAKKAGEKHDPAAFEKYRLASSQAIETEDAGVNNRVCWFGSLDGFVQAVMPSCERAVALAPRDGGWHDTRAVARALAGDRRGAMDDIRYFLEWGKDKQDMQSYVPIRKEWLDALTAGRSPFDAATRARLRKEN